MVAPESLCFFGISGGGFCGALLGGTPGIDWQVGFRRLSSLCKSPMDRSSNENWSQSKAANCGFLHAGQRLSQSGLEGSRNSPGLQLPMTSVLNFRRRQFRIKLSDCLRYVDWFGLLGVLIVLKFHFSADLAVCNG